MVSRRWLAYATGTLVGFVAIVHVALGLGSVLSLGSVAYPLGLAIAFLLSGAALLVGIVGVARGVVPPRPAYALGGVMMGIYLVGYADWHALGYAESVLGLESAGHDHGHGSHEHAETDHDHGSHDHDHEHGAHDHDDSTVEVLIDHLRGDVVALASKTAEAVAAVLALTLAATEQ